MTALIRAELQGRWRMIAGLSGGVMVFMIVMASTFKALGVGMLGSAFTSHMPKAISALSGTPGANLLSPTGWLGFGFAHPMFLVLSCTAAIAIPAAAIAGEVENGRAELLFVRPQQRWWLLAAWVAVWAIAQCIVTVSAVVGTMVGARFDQPVAALGISPILAAAAQSLTLFAFIAGIGFLSSSVARTRGSAAGMAIALTAGLYLVDFISSLANGLGWLRWCSPFGYYTPVGTLTDGFSWSHAAVLLAGAIVLISAAALNLQRRDLR